MTILVQDEEGKVWTIPELCDLSESLGARVPEDTMRRRAHRLWPFSKLIRGKGKARGARGNRESNQ